MTASEEVRHPVRTEEDTLPTGPVLVVLALTVVMSVALAGWAYRILADREEALRPSRVFAERQLAVREEVSDVEQTLFRGEEAARTDRAQRRRLERYEWVDRERGIVAIPMRRAFDLMLQKAPTEGRR